MKSIFLILFILSAFSVRSQSITPSQAKKNVGKSVTVCGEVTSTHYTAQEEGNPTYLFFGAPSPNQSFTVMIRETDLVKFYANPVDWKGDTICVTGTIEMIHGKPEMVVTEPTQIEEK